MKEKYGGTENFVKEGTPPKEKSLKDESKDQCCPRLRRKTKRKIGMER